MFDCFINILKRASNAVFGGEDGVPEAAAGKQQELSNAGAEHEQLSLPFASEPQHSQQLQQRQQLLRQYAEDFKQAYGIEEKSENCQAIARFLEQVQDYNDAELLLAAQEGVNAARADIKATRAVWDRLYNQRFTAMEMRHAISTAYLTLRLKLVTSISNSKLKSNAAVEKVMEQKSLLGMMSKVFWLSFSYFDKVDTMICNTIALRVNEALEDERQVCLEAYNRYRKLVYDKLHDKIAVEELVEENQFEKADYQVKDINLDSAYVSVFSTLGTVVSVLWKVCLVSLFILGMPLTTMMTVVANPTWLSYITEDRNPYILALGTFLTLFFVGLFIVMAIRIFVWNPAVVNSFQQKYRIIGGSLNIYIDSYSQPMLDALEQQFEALNQSMEHYFKEERDRISALNEMQLSKRINDERLLVQFYKGITSIYMKE